MYIISLQKNYMAKQWPLVMKQIEYIGLPQYKKMIGVRELSILNAYASSEGSGESAYMRRLARASAARIRKLEIKMKAQTKSWTSCFAGYVSMYVY